MDNLACCRPELPPRTRRILDIRVGSIDDFGTTSAYAENTTVQIKTAGTKRNYLRVRGEYSFWSFPQPVIMELPPRTRRILCAKRSGCCALGTTSAHAENTPVAVDAASTRWNYLRARGEYDPVGDDDKPAGELPPRTRRILLWCFLACLYHGTTSAHAENTL